MAVVSAATLPFCPAHITHWSPPLEPNGWDRLGFWREEDWPRGPYRACAL